MAADDEEVLRRLEQRLDQASETAQRLMAEAAQEAERQRAASEQAPPERDEPGPEGRRPPPAGWQTPAGGRDRGPSGGELEALIRAVGALRELVPPEVVQRLAEAIKDILLALRALIDWYVERLERRRAEPPSVEDIPID